MKTDKKEQFQGAPKGGPSMALELYSENTLRSREINVRYVGGLKNSLCDTFGSGTDKHRAVARRISEHISTNEEKRKKSSLDQPYSNSFILKDR